MYWTWFNIYAKSGGAAYLCSRINTTSDAISVTVMRALSVCLSLYVCVCVCSHKSAQKRQSIERREASVVQLVKCYDASLNALAVVTIHLIFRLLFLRLKTLFLKFRFHAAIKLALAAV